MIYLILGLHPENEVIRNHIKYDCYRNDREHKCPDFECGFYHVVRSRALLILYCIIRLSLQSFVANCLSNELCIHRIELSID